MNVFWFLANMADLGVRCIIGQDMISLQEVMVMPGKTTEIEGLTVEWVGHSTVGIYGKRVTYIDPFDEVLRGDERKADLVISTHAHRDHFDANAINKLSKDGTIVVVRSGTDRTNLSARLVKGMDIGETQDVEGIEIKAVHAYNTKRFRSPGTPFHPEGFGMGVVMTIEGVKFYYAGDTDFIPPMEKLKEEKIDVAFLPIGGTYTMDLDEAVEAALAIQPRIVIPVHYNYIKGTEADPTDFKRKVESKSNMRAIDL